MSANQNTLPVIQIPYALKLTGIVGGTWGLLVILTATLAYIPGHPEFSLFTTYLSDIGDTPGLPQIFWNSGMLIVAPIRFLVLVLLALRLIQLGAGRSFTAAILIIGLISTIGSVLMTAFPVSQAPSIHKLGIPLYFLGVVFLQSIIGIKQSSLAGVPKILPLLSFLLVLIYFIFATLIMLYEKGVVSRATPVIWEWLAGFSSIVWLFAQSILLGSQPSPNSKT